MAIFFKKNFKFIFSSFFINMFAQIIQRNIHLAYYGFLEGTFGW